MIAKIYPRRAFRSDREEVLRAYIAHVDGNLAGNFIACDRWSNRRRERIPAPEADNAFGFLLTSRLIQSSSKPIDRVTLHVDRVRGVGNET